MKAEPQIFYRYLLTDVFGGVYSKPFGEDDFSLTWARVDDGQMDYKKEMPGSIIFRGSVYDELYLLEKTEDRCDFIKLTIERNCGGAWVPWFMNGRFSLNDAKFNLYKCEVEIKLDKAQPSACLEDNKSQEINLFFWVGARHTVRLYAQDITIEKITYSSNVNSQFCAPDPLWQGAGTPAAGAWVPYYHYYALVIDSNLFTLPHPECYRETRWARQKIVVPVADPSPGPEWTLILTSGGFKTYVKPAILYDCNEEQLMPGGDTIRGGRKECKILGDGGGISEVDNGMDLGDCLQAFCNVFCPGMTVKSEFFQINPDVVTATNYVTGLPSKVRKIRVFQKSDVKRPAVSGNATQAITTPDKFLTALVEMFNVRWKISGSAFRIEHVSYYSKIAGLDLTVAKYAPYVLGKQVYSYKSEEIPSREEFKFMEASVGDFEGLPITYEGGCVTVGRDNVVNHAADTVTTDVELCLSNPDPRSNVVDDKGFVFLAADQNELVISEPPILSQYSKLNNSLGSAQLQRDYHRHYRFLKSGILNGNLTTFLSVRPSKKGDTISIPLICGDTFDPDNTILTALGVGTVEKAVFNFKSCYLTLDLLYQADVGLYVPCLASNDALPAIVGTSTDLDVCANDEGSSTGPITAIEIVMPPSHGIAVVIAGPKIRYTPDPGWTTQDNLVYRVRDASNYPSNNALVSIYLTT